MAGESVGKVIDVEETGYKVRGGFGKVMGCG